MNTRLTRITDAPVQLVTEIIQQETVNKPEPRLYRVIWRWHFYAGLIVLPVLLVAAITGGLYVFKEELERLIYPQLMFVTPQAQTVSYDQQLANVMKTLPADATVHGFSISEDATRTTAFSVETAPERYGSVFVNQYTGAVLGMHDHDSSLFGVILNIHRTLLAGSVGRLLVELATSWGIVLIVTGLYLWWPRDGKKARGVWWPRVNGKSYAIWRDWHTVPGFYISLFAFLVLGTGLFFTQLFARGYQAAAYVTNSYPPSYLNPPKSVKQAGANKLPMDEIVAIARRTQRETKIYVDFPHTAEDSLTIYGGNYDSPSTISFLYLDQYSGEVLDSINWQQVSAVAKVQLSAYAIHIGSIYGLPTKILAVIACLLIVAMSVTGAAMWWIRRPQGKTGFPAKPKSPKPASWLIAVICLLGMLMPAVGASLLLIVFGDWLRGHWLRRNAATTA